MTCQQWIVVVWMCGVPVGAAVNVGVLLGSGGYVTSWLAILRNALLWPVMMPLVIGMYLESRYR